MRKTLFISLAVLFSCSLAAGSQNNEFFILTGIHHDRRIDSSFLARIDSRPVPYPENSSFQIGDIPLKRGSTTVYRFMKTAWAKTSQGIKPVHYLLLLETDKNYKIRKAVHYTLEWHDSPSHALLIAQPQNSFLKPQLPVGELDFRRISDRAPVKVRGLLDNVFKSQKYFQNSNVTDNAAADKALRSLVIRTRDLSEDGGRILYKPGRRRKQAVYTTYVIDKKEFTGKVGQIKNLPPVIKIRAVITEISKEKKQFAPGVSQPQSGFTFIEYRVSEISYRAADAE